jgi:4-hydroxy-tetrahydrodipicolinate synthase
MLFTGLGVALVTPLSENGIDFDACERLIEYVLGGNVDAILPMGTTGEGSTLSFAEKKEFLKFVIKKTAKKVPVIAGTGSNNTKTAIELTLLAKECGADGALVVTPYYNKCTQEGLFEHYKAVCKEGGLPVIAYNVPARTGVNILPATAKKLCEIDGIIAIKEASGNYEQIMETIRQTEGRIQVLSGDDNLTTATMMTGGSGVISVTANVAPFFCSTMTNYALKNDYFHAAGLQMMLKPLTDALFCEVNPIPVKAALSLMGICKEYVRLPLTYASTQTKDRLIAELQKLKII